MDKLKFERNWQGIPIVLQILTNDRIIEIAQICRPGHPMDSTIQVMIEIKTWLTAEQLREIANQMDALKETG